MYGSIVSVLLLGMAPVLSVDTRYEAPVAMLEVAPPASASVGQLPFTGLYHQLSASGVLIMDARSGQAVFEKNADARLPMASLTKLMTALIITETEDLEEWARVPSIVNDAVGNTAGLKAGEEIRIEDLLAALLIPSGNDAADALAVIHGGSVDAFVEEMNDRARILGLKDMMFNNPSGLDDDHHLATARDIAWLGAYVLKNPTIAEIMGTRSKRIRTASGSALSLTHTHQLLHTDPHIIAGKTGTTDEAGQCLLTLIDIDGRSYLVVILGSNDRYGDMRAIEAALSS